MTIRFFDKILQKLERPGYSNLSEIGLKLRDLLLTGRMPNDLAEAITASYKQISTSGPAEAASFSE